MDKAETIFTQKRSGTRLVFEFKREGLSFTHEDGTGENSRNVPYESVDMDNPSELLTRSYYVKHPEYLLYIAGGFMLFAGGLDRSANVVFGLVFACMAMRIEFARRRGIKYTLLNAKDGKILVMQDKQHDVILAELKKYRIARLRKLYGTVNMANDPGKELLKFQWLKEMGVITEQEFEQAQAQIRNPQTNTVVTPSTVQ